MSSKITILLANPTDVPTMAEIRKQGWLSTYVNEEYEITREDILSEDFDSAEKIKSWQEFMVKPFNHTLIADVDGKIVGFAIGRKDTDFNYIKAIYILDQYQGLGIGKMLVEKILAWLGTDKKIKLNVAVYNEKAIKFYEKFGFVKGKLAETTNDDKLGTGKIIPELEMLK